MHVQMATVLVIEDDAEIRILVATALRSAGHTALVASNGRAGLDMARKGGVDLVILDWMLPDLAGDQVVAKIKADPSTRAIPVIILSARVEEADRVGGLEAGADDYVTKPFSVRELMLRTRVALRRGGREREVQNLIVHGGISIDIERREVLLGDRQLALTPTEFRLLATLASRPGLVQTRQALLAEVWGMQPNLETRTVDTHIKRLREKLGVSGPPIETVRGVGYRMPLAAESRDKVRDAVG